MKEETLHFRNTSVSKVQVPNLVPADTNDKRTPNRSTKKSCVKGKAIKHGAFTCSSSNTTQNSCSIGY